MKKNNNYPKTYQYNGYDVTFFKGDDLMINATQMAKAFRKLPKDYLKTQSAKDLINAVSGRTNILPTDLVQVINGGDAYGTWMHETIALDFAQWLSVDFKLWCNEKIKELLQNGYTKLDTISRKDLAKMLWEAEEEKEKLQQQKKQQQKQLKEAEPKIEYYENVLTSKSSYTTTEIAKELGLSAMILNLRLYYKGIQYKVNGTWVLYSPYQNKGYTDTKTYYYVDGYGEHQTKMNTVWTEKGRLFIHKELNL